MNIRKCLTISLFLVYFFCLNAHANKITKIIVVDSYERDYVWSQNTHAGLVAGLLEYGYLQNDEQVLEFKGADRVETDDVIIQRFWMDTKRKKSDYQLAQTTIAISKKITEFEPDIILLGDDNATNYIGNQFLDTDVPIVFWGVNNTPLKYGLVDKIGRPGHNVTGVYQTGYYAESMNFLKKLVPDLETFAILSDSTTSGRSHRKKVEFYARKGILPAELIETVSTDNYEEFKRRAIELSKVVDAFFIAQYSGLKDNNGNLIKTKTFVEWYGKNISIPEVTTLGPFVKEGMLCAAVDSGYNQGLMAMRMANDILNDTIEPADYPVQTPERGPLMVNQARARILGIVLNEDMGVEETVGE